MNKLIVFILIITSAAIFEAEAQRHNRYGDRPNKRIEELRKIKLIETLQMDEETTLKFFARQNKHRESMNQLNEKGNDILDQIEEKIRRNEKGDLNSLINAYEENEAEIFEERNKFIKSLDELLAKEQLARFLVFEQRFREEIRDIILRERRHRRN